MTAPRGRRSPSVRAATVRSLRPARRPGRPDNGTNAREDGEWSVASWDDLVRWVRVRYEVMAQDTHSLTFRLPTTGDRTQLVYVHHKGDVDGHDWLQIESPIGRLDEIDARRLLELAEDAVVGGAAAVGGVAVFRHATPLEDLSFVEFDAPFRLVTRIADQLEHALTGADKY
ncbi:MAG: hypothetical protein AVDCRST_MAG54-977 [uncultured Actinomycetospora sp.]|uniref:Uncharacterized protein n=1 Tax=uncultured Actinomycetospora sp. TaxID=1135996 RepID=A0A6J4HPV9_9PSEU|nr:MAG: hypothetical protein AVDCRST_MAG54-977 [uncultured Actinomycetospora sp.]